MPAKESRETTIGRIKTYKAIVAQAENEILQLENSLKMHAEPVSWIDQLITDLSPTMTNKEFRTWMRSFADAIMANCKK